MVKVTMKYLQERQAKKRGTLSYRYRRPVPGALKEHLGKGEIAVPLGKTLAAATKAYGKVDKEVEKALSEAWDVVNGKAKTPKVQPAKTARELFNDAIDRARDLGVNPYRHEDNDSDDATGHEAREQIADSIAEEYRPSYRAAGGAYATAVDDNDAHERGDYNARVNPDAPVGITKADAALLRVLMTPDPKSPPVTIVDAKKRYLQDRFALSKPSELERKKDEQRAERAADAIVEALGRVPTVASITREEARKVQSYLKGKVAAGTVDRYLNDIRSIINHAIAEFPDLHELKNHFTGLPILAGGRYGGPTPDEEGRPLTGDEAAAIRDRIERLSRQSDLILIWRMLEGTGCRLAEVTGLRVVDVVADGAMPYLDIKPHDRRGLKTMASIRRVPLVGDALDATRAALKLAGENDMLFPRYGVEGGNTAASAALMKHVRAITDDKLARVHSLRHNMADKLKLAGVEEADRNLVLGHTLGGEGKRYGGPEARLEVATRAVRKALEAIKPPASELKED
ncbi:tyrosine-type recombinase/integrase [Mesorhizobium sp. M0048]|uniref:tyrosine-type recombinase/integrase n=1 Tax=Mesorhizobium sp. M0048 TaxID=2956860 RepID=UPI00333B6B6B